MGMINNKNIWKKVLLALMFVLMKNNVCSFHLSGCSVRRPQFSSASTSTTKRQRLEPLVLFSSSSGNSININNNDKLSAASRERRAEEERRRQRQEEVVIGKTSAVRDAKDYRLNPQATQEEWLRQASRVDQQVFRLTEQGMESLKQLQLHKAAKAFEEVFRLKPNAYLWQAGIVKFYLNDWETAANSFAKSAALYESKFGGPASEERIWRHACELKMASSASLANKNRKKSSITPILLDEIRSTLTPIPQQPDHDPDSIFAETRKVVRIASDLFEASVHNNAAGVILARAKLRSIGGNFESSFQQQPRQQSRQRLDIKLWKMHAWFYLGLHYDVLGQFAESKECMKMAFRHCPNGIGDNIVHTLPLLHLTQRDWFDDDDLDVNPLDLLQPSLVQIDDDDYDDDDDDNDNNDDNNDNTSSSVGPGKTVHIPADPLLSDSIRKSIAKMTVVELTSALKVGGTKPHGSKKQLQHRFFRLLTKDVGLAP